MSNKSDTSSAEPAPEHSAGPTRGGSRNPEPQRRHRVLAWFLVVLASVLLVFSLIANWVQREALDTEQVVNTTDEIVSDGDVQNALSIYAVDQLYANVDVQGQIQEVLPSGAEVLAAPVAAAARQLAVDVAQRALASPQVQELVSSAVRRAHEQFISLIDDENEYVSTTGGEITLEYGSVIADLAARLGVDPATISKLQGLVQEYSQDLGQGLTTVQTEIEAVRADLSAVEGGELPPELEQRLETLNQRAAELRGQVASVRRAIKGVQGQVPAQLQGTLAQLEDRLSDLGGRLTALEDRTAAVLRDPSEANVERLDAPLAALEARITTLLERQVVQTPGELPLMSSSQLGGIQTLVRALRNLGYVLPVLALLLYVAAIYLAKGWRPRALAVAGSGILAATLLVLLATRLMGSALVDSLASSETVEPAIRSVWDILSDGLRDRARFVLIIGLAFVGAGLLAGPGRYAVAVRRFLAPYLRDQPIVIYAVVALLFLLWLAFIPGITNAGQVIVIVLLAVLALVGTEALRRQTAREFPVE